MKRREFVTKVGLGALAGTSLAACNKQGGQTAAVSSDKVHEWKMVTAWPKNFPGMGTGANKLAENITKMTGGRIKVTVYGAKELVPALEIFDAVSNGVAQMGHGAAYYWKGKSNAAQFFAAVPFGLNAQEMNGWLYYGGGMELWEETYAPFNLVPTAAANTGVQMGGWFNKQINSLDDLKGLKMRIPGLGGEVLKRLGGSPQNIAGGEIYTALSNGVIDATEWVGPYNDLAMGFYKVAKHYYYPGWHEPGTTLECFINMDAFKALSPDLQTIVKIACQAANMDLLSEYTARNNEALETLVNKHHVDLRPFPDDVLKQLHKISDEVVAEVAAKDAQSQKVYDSFIKFRDQVVKWTEISEHAYLKARDL